MYQAYNPQLAKLANEKRRRVKRVEGIRRSARLISLEIRRSRQSGHQ